MKSIKKFTLGLLLSTSIMSTLVGCGGTDVSGPRTDVKIAINGEPTSLHAGLASSTLSKFIGLQVFDALIYKNEATGEYEPGLATEWVYEDDTTMVFTLREGVKFHNGDPVTAEDVKFTIDKVIEEGYATPVIGFIDSVEIRDDKTIAVNYLFPYGPALECFSQSTLGIMPKAVYEQDPDAFERNPIGSGPYKFTEWKTGTSIYLTANEEYWGNKAQIQHVEFVIYNNSASTAALALENGELDVITTVASVDNKRLSETEGLFFDETAGSGVTFVKFNVTENSFFNDENLRLAVAHGIDKDAVILGAVEGYGTKAITNVPSYCYGVDQGYEPPQYDPEKAKEYLAKAGYPDGFDIVVPASSADNYLVPLEIIQGQLSEIGINIEIEKMDNNAWFEDVFRAGNYDMQMCSFSTAIADIDYYSAMYTTGGGNNFTGISIPELDESYLKAKSTVDQEARLEPIANTVQYLGDHAIIVPLFQTNKAICATDKLEGVFATADGAFDVSKISWATE